MNKKLLLEFIPLTTFMVSGVGTIFKLPYSALITVLSGGLLATIYFYASFWLFAETSISIANRVIAGLVYSITIIACLFCLLSWPFWHLYGIISYSALGLMVIIWLFNYKLPAYKPLLYRCILFLLILSFVFSNKMFSSR